MRTDRSLTLYLATILGLRSHPHRLVLSSKFDAIYSPRNTLITYELICAAIEMLSRELANGHLGARQSRFALCHTVFEQIARLNGRALLSALPRFDLVQRELVTRWLPRSS